MSRYQSLTQNLGDSLTGALERVQNAQIDVIESVRKRIGNVLPEIPRPAALDSLPSPEDIVRANYALAERLLRAQQEYSLRVLEALAPASKIEAETEAKPEAKPEAKAAAKPKAAPRTAPKEKPESDASAA
jgi:hypothetical protein